MKIKITNKDSVPEFIKVFFTRSDVELVEHIENGNKVYEVKGVKCQQSKKQVRSSITEISQA